MVQMKWCRTADRIESTESGRVQFSRIESLKPDTGVSLDLLHHHDHTMAVVVLDAKYCRTNKICLLIRDDTPPSQQSLLVEIR